MAYGLYLAQEPAGIRKVETLEQQLKTLRENEEKMTKKYDKSLKISFQLIKEEKRKTMEANDLFTDKLRIELASASQKLKQEHQSDMRGEAPKRKAWYKELSKQLEANDKKDALTETRLVQYGWHLQSRLDEQDAQSNLMFSSSEEMTKEETGNTHIPSPVGVESETKTLLEALIPASNHRTRIIGSPLRATSTHKESRLSFSKN
ncbi:hypothetical protein E6O75_ATG10887 [Venturia nashicola]|uniref:Uncharacterized protein n=1 Tax=Venturia nashicola TaxID=86259 RepID=A0A4Z1P0J2_9PEZI|nr:hypothetical protein E6O75_ATG10887 [Venturia nashicola]